MKIALIHLSDIHLKSNKNSVSGKIEKFCQSIQNFTVSIEGIFLIITGDIAYSSLALEYRKASEIIDKVKSYIGEYSKKNIHIIMVPGNHDCNFTIKKIRARQILVKDVQENGDSHIDKSIIGDCCEVQNRYFNFMNQYKNDENIRFSDKLIWINEYCFGKYNIVFNCYNTAWISNPDEELGKMHFPIKTYPADHFQIQSNLNIAVLHHTPNWFNQTNRRDFLNHLESVSHIVFTGHEHISTKAVKDNLAGTNTCFVEGGILQDTERDDISNFNVMIADLSQEKHKIYQYEWSGAIYKLANETDWQSYRTQKITNKAVFPINSEFETKFLNNVGAQIRHPNKTEVYLEDIFIFPHLRDLRSYKKVDKDYYRDVVDSNVLCEIKEANNKIVLIGNHNAGKTALCKIIYKYYHNNNYIPIYIEGIRLKSTSTEAFNRIIEQSYSEQYPPDKEQEFDQLDNSKKLIIIDDFDKSLLSSKSRTILIHNINKVFQNVIITSGTLFPLDELLSAEKQMELALEEYEQYQIREFGHLLRSRLINRWYTLGKEEIIDEEELIHNHDEAQQVFNTIIGRNYVPAFPIFLLIILQTIEAGRPHDLEESSFGYYYQYLIFDSLNKVIHKSDEIDAYYNFLTDFSYSLFNNRTYEISKDAFYDFHSQYCKDYAISPSYNELINVNLLINNLIGADIMEDRDAVYLFKYPYIFNFFVAKYLSNNLNDNNIRQLVSNMCGRIYYAQFADIIMFLTHHSKDQFILDTILNNAKSLFSKYVPIRFEDDMVPINELIGEVPKLVLENKDVRRHREEKLQLKDAKEFSTELGIDTITQEIPDLFEPQKQLELSAELNVAFKTIEILGQILKNYSGSLKRPIKLAFGEESYMLGLRALNPLYKILEEKKQNLVKWIRYIIGEEKLDRAAFDEKDYMVLLFAIIGGLSYGFIKTISSSVGSERLSPTFKEILDKHDINSVKLIDTSIKLDFYRKFPYSDLSKVRDRVINNPLPFALLQEMVRDYLYIFPTDYKQKQRICQLVGISIIEQMVIDEKSTQKKLLQS